MVNEGVTNDNYDYCKKGRHNKPRLQPRPFRPLFLIFLLTVCMCCVLMDRNKYINNKYEGQFVLSIKKM